MGRTEVGGGEERDLLLLAGRRLDLLSDRGDVFSIAKLKLVSEIFI